MTPEIILCDLSDANSLIQELRLNWVVEILSGFGVPDEVIHLGTSGRREEFISAINEYGITVELFSNGEVDVYKKVWFDGSTAESSGWLPVLPKHLIAQWKTPERIRRVDNSTGKLHYEVHVKQWSSLNTLK